MAILLISVVIQISSVSYLHAAALDNEITDNRITAAIEDDLIFEKGVLPNDVDVSASQGIVTLSGSVDNILAKERIFELAETIRGVVGVINNISVNPMYRTDDEIHNDALAALQQDPATDSYVVSVFAKDGVVTLTGSVRSHWEKQLAAHIVKGIKGVKDIHNDITINYMSNRTDAEIAADINERFLWDIWVDNDMIRAEVKDGKVVLTGSVGSEISKSRAFDDAWVNGVVSVDDSGIKIEPLAYTYAQKKGEAAFKYANEVKKAIQAALHLDPRVSPFSIDAGVEDGMVTLKGTVGNLKAKTSAEQDVQRIEGVWGIKNLLKVRPKGQYTDIAIREQLKAAMVRDSILDGSIINEVVVNHVVDLFGSVGSHLQKAEAQDVASRIKGVVLVHDHIKVEAEESICYYDLPDYSFYSGIYYNQSPSCVSDVFKPHPYLSDKQITTNIDDGLLLSPFLNVHKIKVVVVDGVITLTGTVHDWIGWNEADKVAHRSGATEVINRIKVTHVW
jgi:osmotically-inducible protein OsmY